MYTAYKFTVNIVMMLLTRGSLPPPRLVASLRKNGYGQNTYYKHAMIIVYSVGI